MAVHNRREVFSTTVIRSHEVTRMSWYHQATAGNNVAMFAECARQKQLGIVPEDTELSPRPAEIAAWADVPDDLKPVLARQMEVYAGFMEHTDHQVGRLVDALGELGVLDDTLIYLIIGDNGASAEGTPNGTFNEIISLNGAAAFETTEFMAQRIDEFGGPKAYNHYAVGWAHAMDTPYQWTKQVASHFGGTRNGTVVHWPKGFADETCDVGRDTGTPVSEDYTASVSEFTGTVNWVELEAGDDNHDHLITPEHLIRVAMALQ